MRERTPAHAHATSSELPWEAQYVEAMLQTEVIASTNRDNALPVELIFVGAAGQTLKASSKFAQRAVKLRAALEAEHSVAAVDFAPTTQRYRLALAQLLAHRMQEAQRDSIKLYYNLALVKMVFSSIITRRLDTRNLQKVQQVRYRPTPAML
jgi:hypothetical protein